MREEIRELRNAEASWDTDFKALLAKNSELQLINKQNNQKLELLEQNCVELQMVIQQKEAKLV